MRSANSADANDATVPSSTLADRRNLASRIVSGIVLGPLVLVLVAWGGPVFALVAGAAAVVGLREWLRMVGGADPRLGYVGLAAVLVAYWWLGMPTALVVLAAATILFGALGGIAGKPKAWFAAAGLPYVGLAMIALPWLRDAPDGGWKMTILLFLLIWASDIGGYVFGRLIGGPKLAPRVSPKKTWAGFAGALIFAALAALGWGAAMGGRTLPYAVAIAVGVSLVGQIGDLMESAVKRRFHLKDSGGLIPGHGGMLDRIDALLAAAPVFALLHAVGGTAGMVS